MCSSKNTYRYQIKATQYFRIRYKLPGIGPQEESFDDTSVYTEYLVHRELTF